MCFLWSSKKAESSEASGRRWRDPRSSPGPLRWVIGPIHHNDDDPGRLVTSRCRRRYEPALGVLVAAAAPGSEPVVGFTNGVRNSTRSYRPKKALKLSMVSERP
ncbi:hypothetical protein DV738_g300, partial [Chaetothyriales sp. CBS 135597]